eukprot:203699-Amorphochlora_amoeboformis.AAC.1
MYESLCINKLANWTSSFPVHPRKQLGEGFGAISQADKFENMFLREFTLFMAESARDASSR